MEDPKNNISDDEDLEALRLAALQTLNKNPTMLRDNRQRKTGFINNKRNRFYNGQGFKNGFNNRIRINNLISITPIDKDGEKISLESVSNSKFTLPQDRYANNKTLVMVHKKDEGSSKFDRYNDSNKSDDESEDEILKNDSPDTTSPVKLERSDSLEALIRELDNEIQDTNINVEKEKKSPEIIKEKEEKSDSPSKTANEEKTVEKVQTNVDPQTDESVIKEDTNVVKNEVKNSTETVKETKPLLPRNRKYLSPLGDNYKNDARHFSHHQKRRAPPAAPITKPYQDPMTQLAFSSFHPIYIQSNNFLPFSERPLSPFFLDAESLQAQTMAPLSPRSAAFVLENRAIIEKRKRSPRRSSYDSRSPTPQPPPSLSSKLRSLSPHSPLLKRRRSPLSPRSPQRLPPRPRSPLSPPLTLRNKRFSPKLRTFSPIRQRRYNSPSIKRRTSATPSPPRSSMPDALPSSKCESLSPKRKTNKDLDRSPMNKPNIRDRLGYKSTLGKSSDNKDNNVESSPNNKEEKPLDPILEARKRKFESKEIQFKEGVIRLKLKKTEPGEVEQSKGKELGENKKKEDDRLAKETIEEDELDLVANDDLELFSDDDDDKSDDENEGRFKAKHVSLTNKPTVLPYTKLISNHTNNSIQNSSSLKLGENKKAKIANKKEQQQQHKSEKLLKRNSPERKKDGDGNKTNKNSREQNNERKLRIIKKTDDKMLKVKKRNKSDEEIRERKIVYDIGHETKDGKRKIQENYEAEILIESGEDDKEKHSSIDKEDLRTQLCKKRAEKRQKNSTSNSNKVGTSRLLQNALQGALPAKVQVKKNTLQEANDGKLPIHLRLGLSSTVESPKKLKEKRRNSIEAEDQV